MPENVTDRKCCHKCQKTVTGKKKLSKCGRCHSITYCGQECQREDWPRHSQYCIPVMVAEIPGMGRGLVASKDFKKGEVIFKEPSAITIKMTTSYLIPLPELKEKISKLSEEQKSKFYQLYQQGNLQDWPATLWAGLEENCVQELDIFLSNGIDNVPIDGTMLLFLTSSLSNHSCSPNVYVEKYFCDEDSCYRHKAIAIKDISKGEEVTQCYTRGLMTKSKMKTKLQEDFCFECKCVVCSGSDPGQDGLISKIIRLVPDVSKHHISSRYHDAQTIKSLYNNTMQDWRKEASHLERAADLINKQLYIGHIQDRFFVFEIFVSASQMARDPLVEKHGILKGRDRCCWQ
uniref:Histone-lysine N-methyltransferase SMYD3 isoform X2 n=1 Tax=Paracalanus parvus TaxID=187406 RepID=A0A0U2KEF9_9MAXI|nr:histone-lysine N-methyltransferase SMYD3 isoform X2 [Paracalanus parvus]